MARWRPAALILLGLAVVGCRPTRPPTDTTTVKPGPEALRLGAIFPLSGGAGRIGEMKRQGADLAIEHLNADGGVGGRPLEIVYADSQNRTAEAEIAFTKLVDGDHVVAVMSAMSQLSLALAAPADRRQVVLFANASHPELPARSPYVFRNLPSTRQTATTIAETAYRELDLRRVAVLNLNDEYGAEARQVFASRFNSLGGEITGAETFESAGTDFRAALTKLAASEPDGWWIPGYGSALGLVLKQLRELRLPGLVMADLGLCDDNVLQTAQGAADRVVVVAPAFDPADPREAVARFVTDFTAEYGAAPSFDAAFQYDAVCLLADALRRTGGEGGAALRQALAETSGFVGVCGPTAFNADGDAELKVVVRTMLDGRLRPLEELLQPPASLGEGVGPTDAAGPE